MDKTIDLGWTYGEPDLKIEWETKKTLFGVKVKMPITYVRKTRYYVTLRIRSLEGIAIELV